jgi:tRNA (guanine37-N1)-methyltransferase
VLLSGNHAEIDKWRRRQSLLRTLRHRPDLLESAHLESHDVAFLQGQGYAKE